MKRGDIWSFVGRGDFSGKPRPGVIVQSDLFNPYHTSITVCPISTTFSDDRLYRVVVTADEANGLRGHSEIEVDKLQAVWLTRLGQRIGRASDEVMDMVDDCLRLWLDL